MIKLADLLRRLPPPAASTPATPATGPALLPQIAAPTLGEQVTQRWRERKDQYRQRGERFDPSAYEVEPIEEGLAKEFVVRHHYSGSYPAARFRAGLFRRRPFLGRELVGVAVFSVPMQNASVPLYAPGLTPNEGVELGRFVLLDDVPFNAESWFLAPANRMLATAIPDLKVVLSYSDPVPRRSDAGDIVMPGHVGWIYQAYSAKYLGRGTPRWQWLDPSGRVISDRTLSKIRKEERGWEYGVRQLLAAGAPARKLHEPLDVWLKRALQEGPFRRAKHPGNHLYAWGLGRWKKQTETRLFEGLRDRMKEGAPESQRQGLRYPRERDVA